MAYKGKPTSTGGEGNIANLLVTLYNDRELSMKEGDDVESPESVEDVSDLTEKIDHLDATIASLTEQLDSFYQEREMIQSALGFSDSKQIVGLVRTLEAQVASLQANRPEQSASTADSPLQANAPASREGLSRLHQVVEKVRMLTAQRDDMQAQLTVLSADSEKLVQVSAQRDEMVSQRDEMEAQRNEMATQRDELIASRNEIAAQRDEMEIQLEALTAQLNTLETQLSTLNADRETLIQALGTADPTHISDTVQSLSAQLESLYKDRELLQSEFQTADPAVVIAEQRKMLNLIHMLEEDLNIAD